VGAPLTPSASLPDRADAIVIGAGFAGLSAAVRLADRGRRVVVIEEAPRLGGRATSFDDRETGERVDNGQHALFGCYRDTYDFLRRIGAAHLAPLQTRLTLTMTGAGRTATLVCPRLPPPWHLLAGLMRWRAVSLADRLSGLRLRTFLRDVARRGAAPVAADVPPDQTVSEWLVVHGQSAALRDWLWHPLAIAALNQLPDVAAARPFVRVLAEMFGSDPASAAIGLPIVPLDDLFAAPAVAFITERGGTVISRTSARVTVSESGQLTGARAGQTAVHAPVVISSVPWHAFGRLWGSELPPGVAGIAEVASSMKNSPIVTVNLWLDPPLSAGNVLPAPFFGFAAGPMHWVFDKSRLLRRGGGSLSMVASGASVLAAMENKSLADAAFAQLRQAVPGLRDHRVARAVVIREPRATFSLAPGGPDRPGAVTRLRGFFLAGDWTDTGLPATIEGAVRSGYVAADAALGAGA
jgi:squalene-associated FAD-dependent desaturase